MRAGCCSVAGQMFRLGAPRCRMGGADRNPRCPTTKRLAERCRRFGRAAAEQGSALPDDRAGCRRTGHRLVVHMGADVEIAADAAGRSRDRAARRAQSAACATSPTVTTLLDEAIEAASPGAGLPSGVGHAPPSRRRRAALSPARVHGRGDVAGQRSDRPAQRRNRGSDLGRCATLARGRDPLVSQSASPAHDPTYQERLRATPALLPWPRRRR